MNCASEIERGKIYWEQNGPQLEAKALGKDKCASESDVLCLGLNRAFVKLNPLPHVWDIQGECYGFLYEGDASQGVALQKCTNKVEGVARVIIAVVIPEANKSYTVMESFTFRTYPMIRVGFAYIEKSLVNHSMRTFVQAAKVMQALNGCGITFKLNSLFVQVNLHGEILVLPSSFASKDDKEYKEPREALLHMASCYSQNLKTDLESCDPLNFWTLAIEMLEKKAEFEVKTRFQLPVSDGEVQQLTQSIPNDLPAAFTFPIASAGQKIPSIPSWCVKRLPNRGEIKERLLFRGPVIGEGCYKRVFAGVLGEGGKTYKVAISVFKRVPKQALIDNELIGNQAAGCEHLLSNWEVRCAKDLFEQISVLYPKNLGECLDFSLLSYDRSLEVMQQAAIGLRNFQEATKRIYIDFKAENILIERKEDGSFLAALGDHGGSGEPGVNNLGTGTPLYAPPELFRARRQLEPITPAYDAWPFGATLLQVVTGINLETPNLQDVALKHDLSRLPAWIKDVDILKETLPKNPVGALIQDCLNALPDKRPLISDLEKRLRER